MGILRAHPAESLACVSVTHKERLQLPCICYRNTSSFLDISEDESLFLALSADESVSYVAKNGRCDKRECGVRAGVLVVMEISIISHSLSQEEEKVTNTKCVSYYAQMKDACSRKTIHFCGFVFFYWNAHSLCHFFNLRMEDCIICHKLIKSLFTSNINLLHLTL